MVYVTRKRTSTGEGKDPVEVRPGQPDTNARKECRRPGGRRVVRRKRAEVEDNQALQETKGIRISRCRGGRGCRRRSGGSRKSRAVLGMAARSAETKMAWSERAWLKPRAPVICSIFDGDNTDDGSRKPDREKSQPTTRWRQTSRSLRTVGGVGPMRCAPSV
jgi:hypothetical protein